MLVREISLSLSLSLSLVHLVPIKRIRVLILRVRYVSFRGPEKRKEINICSNATPMANALVK